jgi:tRNA threonylcarbamoyladenosine biosynthesis protein TsaB
MSFILCIETATEICSVAVVSESGVLSLCENHEGNAHASRLTLLIDEAVKKAGLSLKQLDAIAVSKGPGSYTGLRVGVSTAKGLCYVLEKPLLAINTLQSLSQVFLTENQILQTENRKLIPMLDARRMEVYCAVYDESLKELKPTEAKIIDEHSFSHELENGEVCFFGNGSAKCKTMITHPNAVFVDHIQCSAAGMQKLAMEAFDKKQFEDVAYFEPFYLKDFVGTTPKPKI